MQLNNLVDDLCSDFPPSLDVREMMEREVNDESKSIKRRVAGR